MNLQAIISAQSIEKQFIDSKLSVSVLRGVNLIVKHGEMIAIVGPSGSGKSTLLHILGGLEQPTSGKIEIDGIDISALSETSKGNLRNKYLGFVYQFHHLLSEFTALENVSIPLLIGGISIKDAKFQAKNILQQVGLNKRIDHRINELSGGERQRVAIARALVTNPKCVLADEPTGNLDHQTALQIYDIIENLNVTNKTAFIIVTHDTNIAKRMQKIFVLEDGRFKK